MSDTKPDVEPEPELDSTDVDMTFEPEEVEADPTGDPTTASAAEAGSAATTAVPAVRRGKGSKVDSYLRRQEKQRLRDEKWSRRYRRRRHRILPRTVIGTSLLLVALAAGAAFAGTVLYTWYDFRLQETEDEVNAFEDRFREAAAQIDAQREQAAQEIEDRLEPLAQYTEDATLAADIPKQISDSVYFVATFDEDGRPSAGSAFVVGGDDSRGYLLTSYKVVEASTREPSPAIVLRKGDQEIPATLWAWDRALDLAVVVVDVAGLPILPWAPDDLASNPVGQRIYATSGLGAQGATISPGLTIDASGSGLQHTAAVGTHFRGGPVLTGDGQVLGLASLNYEPLGFPTGEVSFAPTISQACASVLNCAGGSGQLGTEGENTGD